MNECSNVIADPSGRWTPLAGLAVFGCHGMLDELPGILLSKASRTAVGIRFELTALTYQTF